MVSISQDSSGTGTPGDAAAVAHCPSCGAAGPFEHVIDVTEAIEVVILPGEWRSAFEIVDGAEARQVHVTEGGFRCVSCGAPFGRARWA